MDDGMIHRECLALFRILANYPCSTIQFNMTQAPQKMSLENHVPDIIKDWRYYRSQIALHIKSGVTVSAFLLGTVLGIFGASKFFAREFGILKSQTAAADTMVKASIEKGTQTISQMKDLALALSAPILNEMALEKLVTGGSLGDSLEEQVVKANKISDVLKQFGTDPDQIKKVRYNFDKSVIWGLKDRIRDTLLTANSEKNAVFDYQDIRQWDRHQFEEFISKHQLVTPSQVGQYLDKIEMFLSTGSLSGT